MSDDYRDIDCRENINHTAKWNGTAWKSLGKVQTQDQARIEALAIEVASLKQKIKLLNNKLERITECITAAANAWTEAESEAKRFAAMYAKRKGGEI